LAKKGHRVGLMDADLFGPSMGVMFGVEGSPMMSPHGNILPVEKFGIKLMSMGFLIDDDQPIVWRGPMLNKALSQFMSEVDWGDLDYLLIDLPPGTGDIQISLVQLARVSSAVIVSTPQDVAFLDAKKAITMFRTVNVPILGVIENMSSFICPSCKAETPIFGH
jgi:ATP-binding protein involved in chromosome partitioning